MDSKSHNELKKNKDNVFQAVDDIHDIYVHNQKRQFDQKYKIKEHHKKKGIRYLNRNINKYH